MRREKGVEVGATAVFSPCCMLLGIRGVHQASTNGRTNPTSLLQFPWLLNYAELSCQEETLGLCCTKKIFEESQFCVPPVISVGYCHWLTVPDTPSSCQSRSPQSSVLTVAEIHSGQLYHSGQLTGDLMKTGEHVKLLGTFMNTKHQHWDLPRMSSSFNVIWKKTRVAAHSLAGKMNSSLALGETRGDNTHTAGEHTRLKRQLSF